MEAAGSSETSVKDDNYFTSEETALVLLTAVKSCNFNCTCLFFYGCEISLYPKQATNIIKSANRGSM